MRLAIAQLDPELLIAAALEVRDKDRLARRAEAQDVVFDMYATQLENVAACSSFASCAWTLGCGYLVITFRRLVCLGCRYKRRVIDDPQRAAEEKAEREAARLAVDGEPPNDGDAKGFRKV